MLTNTWNFVVAHKQLMPEYFLVFVIFHHLSFDCFENKYRIAGPRRRLVN